MKCLEVGFLVEADIEEHRIDRLRAPCDFEQCVLVCF